MIIVIDGPSGTGKSTLAKKIAVKLGFSFFDTGAGYRSLAFWLTKNKINTSSLQEVASSLAFFHYDIGVSEEGEKLYFVDGEDVSSLIRTSFISSLASQIAAYPDVRAKMCEIQRDFAKKGRVVFEGRDMGTVVFPQADVKIFLTADPKVRAKRRFEELLTKFPELAATLKEEEIYQELQQRDQNDANREHAPLKKAEDAVLIDTSSLTIEEVEKEILREVMKKKRYLPMKPFYKMVYWAARLFFKTFFRLEIYGLEHFQEGAAILASNHTSNYDPCVLSISCPEEVHFLAKESLFKIPILGKVIRKLNAHPVSGRSTDASTFKQILQLLQEGKKVILFPEGTRSPTGELQPLERGMAFIAYKANCPIIPAYIEGTFSAWPQGQWFPKLFGKVRIVFGAPIELESSLHLDRKEAEKRLTEKTQKRFKELKIWLEKGAKGIP